MNTHTLHHDPAVCALIDREREKVRTEIFDFLRTQADMHHGEDGDAIRRGAINSAADRIRDLRPAGRGQWRP